MPPINTQYPEVERLFAGEPAQSTLQYPLCTTFLALYSIANSKGAKVAEVWDSLGEGGGWNPRFGRGFNDWELDMVQDFITAVHNKKIASTVKDRPVWKWSTNETFSVKSY